MREEFVDEEYLEVMECDGNGYDEPYYESTEIKRRSDLSESYLDCYNDEPCGYECSFDIEVILSDEEEYEEFINELVKPECPVRIQYEKARELMKRLARKESIS